MENDPETQERIVDLYCKKRKLLKGFITENAKERCEKEMAEKLGLRICPCGIIFYSYSSRSVCQIHSNNRLCTECYKGKCSICQRIIGYCCRQKTKDNVLLCSICKNNLKVLYGLN